MNRKALEAFLSIDEQDRFTRGLVTWIGFKQAYIDYIAKKRQSGSSKYTFRRMRIFAVDGVTSFSARPLRMSTTLGFVTMFAGILYSVYAIIMKLLGNTNPGWTSVTWIWDFCFFDLVYNPSR